MIVTGAFLADFARACDQKLDAIGAVRDNYTFLAGEALEAKLSVVSLLQSERLLTDSAGSSYRDADRAAPFSPRSRRTT